ncbi:MAG: hypothetical protein WBA98_08265, partial [Gordonia sp. (in: high G+C Gram-positive bacteria)]
MSDDVNPEGFNRGPANCICGPLYHYGGHEEPGQYSPDCPFHGMDCGHPNHGAQDHDCRPFTNDVVQRARQALDGITPGPWEIDQDWALVAHGSDSVVHVHMDECPCGERTVADVEVLASAEDMTFIAAAPQLVDDLAAEVEKLR